MFLQEETDLQPVQRPFTDQSMYNSIDQCTAESDISDQHRMHVQGPLEVYMCTHCTVCYIVHIHVCECHKLSDAGITSEYSGQPSRGPSV